MSADILKNIGRHSVSSGKRSYHHRFCKFLSKLFFLCIPMQWKDYMKSLACMGYWTQFYELLKLVVLTKQKFKLPQNQQVRFLSWLFEVVLGSVFFIMSRFLESLLQQVSGYCLIFVKKITPKSQKLMFTTNFTPSNDLILLFWSNIYYSNWQKYRIPPFQI